MKTHMVTQHKVEDLKCDACDFLTSSQALLGRHIVEHQVTQQNVAQNPPVSDNSTEQSGNKVLVSQEYNDKILSENAELKEELSKCEEGICRFQDIFETRNNVTKTDNRETGLNLESTLANINNYIWYQLILN